MSFDLFQRGPLQQETGALAERWQQDGSSIINLNGANLSVATVLHTVSANKKFYVKSITLSVQGTGDQTLVVFRDGGGSGTERFRGWGDKFGNGQYSFGVPLEFVDDVHVTPTIANANVTITGWEE